MKEKLCALLGVIGPLVAYASIEVSIARSPWFSWENNALSDLGHAIKSEAAPIFNLGLLLAGFLIAIYAVTIFRNHAKYTSLSLMASAFSLQLVATFNEVYVSLHNVVSVLFFISMGITSLGYAIEKRSALAAIAFIIGLGSWILYGVGIYHAGVAVPETISSIAVTPWIIYSTFKIYRTK